MKSQAYYIVRRKGTDKCYGCIAKGPGNPVILDTYGPMPIQLNTTIEQAKEVIAMIILKNPKENFCDFWIHACHVYVEDAPV